MMVLHPHHLIVCLGEKALVAEEGWDGKPEGSKFNRVKSKDPWVHYPFQNCMPFPRTKLLKKDVDTFYYYLWPSALGIKPVSAKGNPPRIVNGRTDAEAEAPIFWPPDVKRPWCWERLRVGEEGGDRRWDGCMATPTQWTWVWALVKDRKAWDAAVHGVEKSQTRLSDWTTTTL